jgi:hypothetical protein
MMNENGFIWLLIFLVIWMVAGILVMGDYSHVWNR